MDKVFVYWDNSNIFISAREVAIDREGEVARYRIRIHLRNLLRLAHGDREIGRAVAVGSIPPELRHVWNRLENEGIEVQLFERGAMMGREQGVDQALQVAMLRDAFDHNGDPGVAVLLTGDGAGFYDGVGFRADLERMRHRGWRIEVLSWRHSCKPQDAGVGGTSREIRRPGRLLRKRDVSRTAGARPAGGRAARGRADRHRRPPVTRP